MRLSVQWPALQLQSKKGMLTQFVLVLLICLVVAALVLQVRAHTKRLPLHLMPRVALKDLPRPLKTGDIILSVHDAHMNVFKHFGMLGRDLANIATLHIGVVWVHPEHGISVVEGVNGSRVGRNRTASTDCAFDAVTKQHFMQGVRVVPIERYLDCYEGVVAVRLVRDGLQVNERGFETVMQDWLLKQPFRTDFHGARFFACWGRVVFSHALGLDKLQVDHGGVVCSEVAAIALAAAGLWDIKPDSACPYEDGAAFVKRLVPEASACLEHNKHFVSHTYDKHVKGTEITHNMPASKKQHEHLPMHFASNGDVFARAFFGSEIVLGDA